MFSNSFKHTTLTALLLNALLLCSLLPATQAFAQAYPSARSGDNYMHNY